MDIHNHKLDILLYFRLSCTLRTVWSYPCRN